MSFEFDIRFSDALKDGPTLDKWLTGSKDLKWYPVKTKDEVKSMSSNWIGFSKYKASLTATHKNQAVGIGTLYLMPYKKVSHHAMFYIIVGKSYRRKGVGSSLVKNLKNLAKTRFKLESIHCEVFEGCPLIPILEKEGFETFAEQEGFSKDGNEYLSRKLMESFL